MASLLSNAALAGAVASAYVTDERVHGIPIPSANTGAVTAFQQGFGADGGFAQASADGAAGTLRVAAQAGLNGPYLVPADASAAYLDNIVFSGGLGLTAYLDYAFEGDITLAGAPYPQAAYAQLFVGISTIIGGVTRYETLSAFAGNCGGGVNCVVGTSTARTGSVAIPITEYGTAISTSLRAFSTYGNFVAFGNSAEFYLRVPDGVT